MPLMCPICMEVLVHHLVQNVPKILSTPCGHVFHENCLNNWFANKHTCPQCRKAIKPSRCIQLFLESSSPPTETDSDDVLSLKAQIDSLKFDLKVEASKIVNKEEHLKKGMEKLGKMRERVIKKEREVEQIKHSLLASEEKNRSLIVKLSESNAQLVEFHNIKNALQRYMWIDDILNNMTMTDLDFLNNISHEDCRKLIILYKRQLREEQKAHESANNSRLLLSQEVLKMKNTIAENESEMKLITEVLKAYKAKAAEEKMSSVIETPRLNPISPQPRIHIPLASSSSHNESSNESSSPNQCQPTSAPKPKNLYVKRPSPSLALNFKVVTKRRKLL